MPAYTESIPLDREGCMKPTATRTRVKTEAAHRTIRLRKASSPGKDARCLCAQRQCDPNDSHARASFAGEEWDKRNRRTQPIGTTSNAVSHQSVTFPKQDAQRERNNPFFRYSKKGIDLHPTFGPLERGRLILKDRSEFSIKQVPQQHLSARISPPQSTKTQVSAQNVHAFLLL